MVGDAKKGHWVLRPYRDLISMEEFMKAASFLYSVRMERETAQESATVGTQERDDRLWAQIQEKGPALCIDQLWTYESEWTDSESSDDESCGVALDFKEGKGRYSNMLEKLYFVLHHYVRNWKRGLSQADTSNEFSSKQKTLLRGMLYDDWNLYTCIVFHVMKYHERPSQLFEALGSSRIYVEFICDVVETNLDRQHSKFCAEYVFLQWMVQDLLTLLWYEQTNRLKEETPMPSTFDFLQREKVGSSEFSIDLSGRKKVSTNLQNAIDIITEVSQTADEWSGTEDARKQKVMQELSSRYHAVTMELQNLPTSTKFVPGYMRQSVLELFSDLADNVLGQIQQLLCDVGEHIPYVIDNALTKYRMERVWTAMDVYSDCMSWYTQLYTVTDDISGCLLPTNKVASQENACLRGSMLDPFPEQSPGDFEQALILKMERKFLRVSRDINFVMPKKNDQESMGLPS